MLQSINLELFGAFSGMLIILIWLVAYFKGRAETAEERIKKITAEELTMQDKQLEVLRKTNALLSDMLEKKTQQK